MSNELQVINQNEIAIAFNVENGIQSIINNIRNQVDEKINGVVWDFSKKKDRDLVASLAHKVARSKTAIDAEGKKLKEQYTVITNKIDAERKLARDMLDIERDRIRQPLTDWENAEKERKAKLENDISEIKRIAIAASEYDSTFTRNAISDLESRVIDSSFEEYEQEAKLAKLETLEVLRTALASREKYEAEQAELERLRQAEQARLQREHEERIAREAAEKATREAEEKARFEAERVQREKAESEQREARLKAEKEAAELRAVQAAENERKRIEAEQVAKAEAARKAEEARLANVEHMRQINNDVLQALISVGLSEDLAKAAIKAIAKNEIPHTSIKY